MGWFKPKKKSHATVPLSLGFFQYFFFTLEEVWLAPAPVYSRLSSSALFSSLLLLPSLSLVGRRFFII
jgi:hypothetical protein